MLYKITGGRPPRQYVREIITRDGIVVRAPDGFQWAIGKSISYLQSWCGEHRLRVTVVDARTV